MKKITFSLSILLIAFMVILSIPAFSQGMSDRGNGPSDEDVSGSSSMKGPGKGPLEKGFNYRYGTSKPSASVEDETGENSIELSLEAMEHIGDEETCRIDSETTEWEVSETEGPEGKVITYQTTANWKGENDENKGTSEIIVKYSYKWEGEKRSVDIDIEVEDTLGEGELKLNLGVSSEGLESDYSINDEIQNMNGHRYNYQTMAGENLGEIIIDEEAGVEVDGVDQIVGTNVEINSTTDGETLSISSTLTKDTGSYSVSGSLVFFEELLEIIAETGKETVSYVKEHIVSFSIGLSFLVVVFVAAAMILSNKKKDTGGAELKLVNNRYYKNN